MKRILSILTLIAAATLMAVLVLQRVPMLRLAARNGPAAERAPDLSAPDLSAALPSPLPSTSEPPAATRESTNSMQTAPNPALPTQSPTTAQPDTQAHVDALLSQMSLEEKVGQLFLVYFQGPVLSPDLRSMIADYHIGGVVLFAIAGNVESPAQVARLIGDAQAEATTHGAGVPLFVAVDQEGGTVVRLTEGATVFPSQMAVGASGAVEDAQRVAEVTAQELKALGINVNLTPVLDVNNNPDNPVIGLRSFGASPDLVTTLGMAMIETYRAQGMLAVAKHFPGHGDTAVDSHYGLPVVPHDRARLDAVELAPFRAAVEAGVPAIMTAHVLFPAIDPDPARPATLSSSVLQGLLRQEMGFDGLIVTDSLSMGALDGLVGAVEAAQLAFRAGADVLAYGADRGHSPAEQKAAIDRLLELVRSGEISEQRLDGSVRRILLAKAEYGLLDWQPVSLEHLPAQVGTAEHLAVARQVARQSITLVKDDAAIFPLQPGEQVLVVWPEVVGDLGHPLATCRSDLILRPVSLDPTPTEIEQIVLDAQTTAKVVVGTANARRHPAQVRLVEALQDRPLIVAALAEPYDLIAFPQISTYLATYGAVPVSLEALAQTLCGEAPPGGKLPVDLPGLYPLDWSFTHNHGSDTTVNGVFLPTLGTDEKP